MAHQHGTAGRWQPSKNSRWLKTIERTSSEFVLDVNDDKSVIGEIWMVGQQWMAKAYLRPHKKNSKMIPEVFVNIRRRMRKTQAIQVVYFQHHRASSSKKTAVIVDGK